MLAEAAELLLLADYQQMPQAISQALGLAGSCLRADLVGLFELGADQRHLRNSHAWCAPGLAVQPNELHTIALSTVPWWWQQLLAGKPVLVSDVAKQPAAELAQIPFESYGIRAWCGVPLQQNGQTFAFVGFGQIGKARDWCTEQIDSKTMLARLINSALLRGRSEQNA